MADPLGSAGVPNFAHPFLATLKSTAAMHNSYRLDEGYSEDTRSQTGSELRGDMRMGDLGDNEPIQGLLPDWITSMAEVERSEFAYLLLRSLRTSSIAGIVDRLYPLLHIDPINYLPPEVMVEVFSYLDPQTLLRASTLSRTWRTRALDARLWRRLFGCEGWSVNMQEVRNFESEQRIQKTGKGKGKARMPDDLAESEGKSPKRRVRERYAFGDEGEDVVMTTFDNSADAPRRWADQHGIVEADEDANMEDIVPAEVENTSPVRMPDLRHTVSNNTAANHSNPQALALKSLLIYLPGSAEPRLNWQYLYKQKRRLEENWIAGRYTNFQLPHPNHQYEAHSECVYTIQYTRKHLVSGSRDHTLRIWNLDTQRLMVPPLQGHDASVLCLQFDDRPSQDIVVSGGSDCNVILWRFSTGKMIRKLCSAHGESVLNLRFDDRVLVTCSKDKTIKVWNRQSILPTDSVYPQAGQSTSAKFPSYILNIDNLVENNSAMKPLEEYSLLMTLYGHTAAVNAIQILDNQIVSASGDRHVKVWDVRTGVCLKTIPGHQKGIACVQFDGRRIVSGSSDETVRIFDRSTAAEVACLRGHTNLVRTVQARFGDGPDSALEDEAEAKAVDRKFFAAKLAGQVSEQKELLSRKDRKARNGGSKDPKDVFAIGAKLPPGGGGSRWARIVSGSYDETVIIWKRNPDNKWVPAHQLYQWQAVLNAGGQLRFVTSQQRHGHAHVAGQTPVGGQANNPAHTGQHHQHVQATQAQSPAVLPAHQAQAQAQAQTQAHVAPSQSSVGYPQHIVNQHQGSASPSSMSTAISNTVSINGTGPGSSAAATNGSASVSAAFASGPSSNSPQQTSQQSHSTVSPIQIPVHLQAQAQAHRQALLQAHLSPIPPIPQHHSQHHHSHQHLQQLQLQLLQNPSNSFIQQITQQAEPSSAAQAHAPSQSQPQQQTQNAVGNTAHHHPIQHQHAAQPGGIQLAAGTNSRVFKLQFDSRRIICCSQDPTIVGWDFANGDDEIIRASQFFGDD